MKTIEITIKQGKDVGILVRKNVQFYSFDKQYLAITYTTGKHSYFKLSTVLALEEVDND